MFVLQKLGMKLLEMVKNKKIKHSVSSTLKGAGGLFSLKNVFHERTNFFVQIYGKLLYMVSNDQTMQGGRRIFTKAFSGNLDREIFPRP